MDKDFVPRTFSDVIASDSNFGVAHAPLIATSLALSFPGYDTMYRRIVGASVYVITIDCPGAR